MDKFMNATEARKKFFAIVDAAGHPGVAVTVTHEGVPKVVIMSFEEYEGWQETMEIMADPELSADILQSLKQLKKGKLKTVDYDTFRKSLKL